MIEVKDLTKYYGDKLALDHVSFSIKSGEVVGLLGLNGAGKSTTMNILTGYISATDGSVSMDGHDIAKESGKAKRVTGYLPETPAFYPEMRVDEQLHFICDLKGVTRNKQERETMIADVCERVGLAAMRGRMIRNLSKGYRQRVGFAQALVGNPKIVILDEPTVGLDPSQIIDVRKLIHDLGKTATVIVSSHILSEIQTICSRVIVIHQGRVIADDSPEQLAAKVNSTSQIKVRVKGDAAKIKAALEKVKEVRTIRKLPVVEEGFCDFALAGKEKSDIRAEVSRALAKSELALVAMQSADASLESIFLNLVGDAAEQGEK